MRKKHDRTDSPVRQTGGDPAADVPINDSTITQPSTRDNDATIPASGAAAPPVSPAKPFNASVRVSRYAILGLLTLVAIALFPIIRIFIVPIILATTFTTLFYPLYKKLLRIFRNNKPISSLATCLFLILCLIVPLYIVIHVVVLQLIGLYQSVEPSLKDIVAQGSESELFQRLKTIGILRGLDLSNFNIVAVLGDAAKTVLASSSKLVNKTSAGVFGLVANIIIMFFTMFYFFLDGERIVQRIKYLSPIRDDYEDLIIARFLLTSRATVLGTLIIGITQGTIGAMALLIFGIKSWLLWGVVMIFLSCIPLVGAWLVLIPAGLVQIFTGHVWQGIGIIAISMGVVSTIDNLIRPRLVGQGAKLHDLIIFFSSIGGILTFGPMGIIVGPVTAALFISMLDIYSTEFEQQLKEANVQEEK